MRGRPIDEPVPRWRIFERRRCPHPVILGIYGDAINFAAGYRLLCARCETLLDGPVSLAGTRRGQ